MLIGIPVVSLIIDGILYGELAFSAPGSFFGGCLFIGLMYTIGFWIGFRELFFQGIRKYSHNQRKRYSYMIITTLLLYIAIKLFMDFVVEGLLFNLLNINNVVVNEPSIISVILSSIVVTVMVLAIYESSYLNTLLHRSVIEKQALQKQNIQSQLEGIRNKVNPHFLFNSLNTLCTLIPESPERAERFVRHMSKVYRYILEIRDEKLIPLSEELEYLDAFKHLLIERFEDNLSITVDIPESHHSKKIIPLSLQILLENAIKHNVISKFKPLHIKLYVDSDGRLAVENNLQVKRQVSGSTKFGLDNIKQRYGFFTDKTVEVIATTQNFIVLLPLIASHEH